MNAYSQIRTNARALDFKHRQVVRGLIILLLLSVSFDAPRVAFGQSFGEPLGALLLKNDRVLLGQVERQGDVFLVRIADSSQVSIPKDQAQYLGRDINDLYTYKRQTLVNPNTGDHFKLTRWCMANNLLDQAVIHYQVVAKNEQTHPKVKQLAVELRNQLLEVPEFRSYLGLPPQEKAIGMAGSSTPAKLASPGVITASHKLENPPHPLIVQRFGDRVQPVLINRCSQAACHGGRTSTELKLIEPSSRGYAQTTASNLGSVLLFAEANENNVVPLIAYATQAHGLQRQPGIAVTEAEIVAELQAWVELVRNPVVSAVASSPTGGLRPTGSGLVPVGRDAEQLKMVPRREQLDIDVANIEFPTGNRPPTMAELDALERQFQQSSPGNGSPVGAPSTDVPKTPPSRDPFDPTEFNRRVQGNQNGSGS